MPGTETSPGCAGIGQHKDCLTGIVIAHQRSHIPSRRCRADGIQVILERVPVSTVGICPILAHYLQTADGDKGEYVVIRKFGYPSGLDRYPELIRSRSLEYIRRRQPGYRIAFRIILPLEHRPVNGKTDLGETLKGILLLRDELQTETVFPIGAFQIYCPAVLRPVELELGCLGTGDNILAFRVADHISFDIPQKIYLSGSH